MLNLKLKTILEAMNNPLNPEQELAFNQFSAQLSSMEIV